MSLHWQRATRDFAFCFLRHNRDPGRKECNSSRVRTGRQEKGLFFQIFQLTWLFSVVYEWDSVTYQVQARPRNYASAGAIFPTGADETGLRIPRSAYTRKYSSRLAHARAGPIKST